MRILGAAIVVLVLAGCAQPVSPVEPVETPAPAPVLVDVPAPAQVFDGDCAAMFTDAALSEAFGQPVSEWWQPYAVDPEQFLIEQAGGIRCAWGEPNSPYVLHVLAVPAGAVSGHEETQCIATMISETSCPVDVTANGIRLSGIVTADLEGSDSPTRAAAVEALFTASANAAAVGAVPTPLAEAWTNPTDCSAIADRVDFAAILGASTAFQADEMLGTDVYSSSVETELKGGRALYWCTLFAKSKPGIGFALLGGGAWNRDAVLSLEGATVVSVPGLELVVERPVDNYTVIDVFDGVNWLQSNADDPELLYPALIAIVDYLNAQA